MILKLKTSNCILRAWKLEDAPAITSLFNQKDIFDSLQTEEDFSLSLEWTQSLIKRAKVTPSPASFSIFENDQFIGSIFLKSGSGIYRYSAKLYFGLFDPYWNKGITSDAIRCITTYALQKLKVKRVYSTPFSSNPAACRVLEKAGFQYEGRLKCSAYKEGQFVDQLIYSRTSFEEVEH